MISHTGFRQFIVIHRRSVLQLRLDRNASRADNWLGDRGRDLARGFFNSWHSWNFSAHDHNNMLKLFFVRSCRA